MKRKGTERNEHELKKGKEKRRKAKNGKGHKVK